MQDRLIKYVRDWSGNKVGCVVAVKNVFSGIIFVGWSQCHPSDTFNKEKAIEIATGRAIKGSNKKPAKVLCLVENENGDYPTLLEKDVFKEEIIKMLSRADRYFKLPTN